MSLTGGVRTSILLRTRGDPLSAKYKFPNRITGIGWSLILFAIARGAYLLVVELAAEDAKDGAAGALPAAKTLLLLQLLTSFALLVAGIGLIGRQRWAWWTSVFFLGGIALIAGLEVSTGAAKALQDTVSIPHTAVEGPTIALCLVMLWLLFISRPRLVTIRSETSGLETVDARTMAVLEATKKMSSRATEDWGVEVEDPELLESLLWMTQARMSHGPDLGPEAAEALKSNEAHDAQQVAEHLEELPRVFEASTMAIAVTDPRGSVTLWNPSCEQLLGFPAVDVIGSPIPLGTPADGTDPGTLMSRTAADGALIGVETEQRCKDGSVVPVSMSISVLPDTKRGVGGFVMAMTDLTARREALAQELKRRRSEALEATQDEIMSQYADAQLAETTHGKHAQRVMSITTLVSHQLGMDNDAAMEMGRAALLHDIGKVGVPPEIWKKKGRLTDEEFESVKTHVHVGHEMLTSTRSPALQAAAEIAYSHHERWDGYGYLGLSGDGIPLGARIVSVADAFDALTHDRPYRKARTTAQALEEIRKAGGTQFDPRVVEAFLAVSRSGHLETINAD